jgi:hypothetical protein
MPEMNQLDRRVIEAICAWMRLVADFRGLPPAASLLEIWEDEADGCQESGRAIGDLSCIVAFAIPEPYSDDLDSFIANCHRWERLAHLALRTEAALQESVPSSALQVDLPPGSSRYEQN